MIVKKGSTNVTTYFVLRLAATGVEATGLTIANVDLQYVRSGVAPSAKVDATALAATDTAHTDNFGIEIDATDQPGLYRFDWPDAAFATGVPEVILSVKCATVFTEHLRVELVGYDPTDGVRLGLTALPNAAADAAGGLPISDAGALDLDARLDAAVSSRMATYVQPTGFLAATFPAGTVANTTNITAGTITTATNVTTVNGLAANVITAAATAVDFGTEVANAVWDMDATGHQTAGTFGQAIGDPGADTTTIYEAVVTAAAGTHIAADIIAVKAQTAAIEVDTAEIGAAGAGLTNINLPNQTMDIIGSITGNLSGSVGSVAAGGIAAASFAAGAIDAAAIANAAIDAATFAADVDAEILSYIVDDATRIDASALNTASVTTIPAIVADTNELQTDWANGGRLDLILDIIAADTTTDIPALIATLQAFVDTEVAAILADTNELQTDWTNGGRLDLLIDAIKAKTDALPSDPADASVIAARFDTLDTSVADLPTNAELATALGTADDAVLAAVADLPTNAELATALAGADDAVLAQIALVKAKTDSLTFTVANEVNANVQSINDTALIGDGDATPWGPA
jgi:hypothetical protein